MARSRAVGLAHEQRPRHVRAIAADLGPEVEQQHLAGGDRALGRRTMGQRRPRPGQTRDIEGERLRTVGAHLPFQGERQLALRDARPDGRQQPFQRRVRDRAGCADPLQLGGLLGLAQLLDPAVGRAPAPRPAPRPPAGSMCRGSRAPASTPRASPAVPGRRRDASPRAAPASAPAGRCRRPRCASRDTARCAWTRYRESASTTVSSATTRNWPGHARDRLLARGELEARQVPGVLAAHPEPGIDPLRRQAVRKRRSRSGRAAASAASQRADVRRHRRRGIGQGERRGGQPTSWGRS